MASWSKDNILSFIELYRSLECLWKVGSQDYSNRMMKEKAYKQLVAYVREFEPRADREYVTKKINSLRTSFRKELRKVINSKLFGAPEEDVYVPSLWYFNSLMFLQDQDELTSGAPISSTENMQHHRQDDARGRYDTLVSTQEFPTTVKVEESDGDAFENSLSDEPKDEEVPTVSDATCTPGPSKRFIPTLPAAMTPSVPSPYNFYATDKSRFRTGKRRADDDVFNLMRHRLNIPHEDEHDCFAKTIAYKMRKLTEEQCLHAEKLMSDVLYEARLGNLSRASSLVAGPPTSYA